MSDANALAIAIGTVIKIKINLFKYIAKLFLSNVQHFYFLKWSRDFHYKAL